MESHKKISSIRRYFQRYKEEVEEALDFLEWLEKQTLDLREPTISWEEEIFRITYSSFNPLSVAGSLATGGRFNIGGAQMNHFFSHLPMEACLYAASSVDCAKKEVGNFLGNARFFALKPKKPLLLWDLLSLIRNIFNHPQLEHFVNSSPLVAIWAYQKVPKISQILGNFIRRQGGDGLVYPSTKDPKGQILAFFVKDDETARHKFTAREVKYDESRK